ncbi:MAG: hypothetical protein UZ17_ACD001002841 [Acidobacteria bacterium OLB17]|nr:MAG: hypothetical protein UZ17_ACD001002841 [Acidobacteria bacterium OLB17]
MNKFMRHLSEWAWIGVLLGCLALALVIYVKWKFVFSPGNNAVLLIRLAIGMGLAALFLAGINRSKWQMVATIGLVMITAYLILFTSLYMVP